MFSLCLVYQIPVFDGFRCVVLCWGDCLCPCYIVSLFGVFDCVRDVLYYCVVCVWLCLCCLFQLFMCLVVSMLFYVLVVVLWFRVFALYCFLIVY